MQWQTLGFIIHDEVWAPPHKCWARKLKDAFQGRGPPGTHLSPYHSHTGIHPASWTPLFSPRVRFRNVWRRWLLGQEQWQGLEYYLWESRKPPPCGTCGHRHARDIHTGIAVCPRFHGLRNVLFHTFPVNARISQWWNTASAEDRRLLGRLLIPKALFEWWTKHGHSPQQVYGFVKPFQRKVMVELMDFRRKEWPTWLVAHGLAAPTLPSAALPPS